MLRRRRPLLRAAAVGGGAYIAGKHMANKANEQAAMGQSQQAIATYKELLDDKDSGLPQDAILMQLA